MVYPSGLCFLGDNCKAPTHELLNTRHMCYHCGVQLHPPTCGSSVLFAEDKYGIIKYLPDKAGTNCSARLCAQPTSQGKKRNQKSPKRVCRWTEKHTSRHE